MARSSHGGPSSGSGGKTGSSGKTGSIRLAELVRERREQLGMTRQDLADATGIPYPTVAQIETAYRGVSPSRLTLLARALGLDPTELYGAVADDAERDPEPQRSAASTPAGESAAVAGQAEDVPAPAAAGWYANAGFRAGPALAPATPPPPTGAPAMVAGLPRRQIRPHPSAASKPGVAGAGPSGMVAGPSTPQPDAEVITDVMALLSTIPAEARLEALSRIQQQVMADLVEERVRERGED